MPIPGLCEIFQIFIDPGYVDIMETKNMHLVVRIYRITRFHVMEKVVILEQGLIIQISPKSFYSLVMDTFANDHAPSVWPSVWM